MGQAGPDGSRLARKALDWLLGMAHKRGTALAWTGRPDDDEPDPTLYSGTAGIVLALLEGYRHFGEDRYAQAAARGARTLAAAVTREWPLSSLYFGLAGLAFALREVGGMLGDRQAARAAVSALDLVRSRFDGQRWADQFELLGGNAGIALGAARAGDLDLAVLAVTPYLAAAEPTAGGVHWEVRAGVPARFHHLSHGTLGIVYALAATGFAAGRADLIDLALAGAAMSSRVTRPARRVSRPALRPAAQAGTDRALQLRLVPRPGGRRPGLPAAGPGHRRPGLDQLGWPMLAHRHLLRPAPAAAARVLGQQRPLLRHSRGPGPGLRPADRTRGRADVRERPGQRPQRPGYR